MLPFYMIVARRSVFFFHLHCCLLFLESRSRRVKPARLFTALNPDSSRLVWNTQPQPGHTVIGKLTVNIDPEDNGSPTLELQVKMRLSEVQPAPNSPLLMHCGGPGSDIKCLDGADVYGLHLDRKSHDVWAISQRGIGENSPAFKCSSTKLPPKGRKPSEYKISDFTDCPCAMVDNAPMFYDRGVGIDPENETEVRNLLEHVKTRGQRCYNSSKFQIKDDRNGKVYNFLEWSGTQMLAHDIDIMRRAIGATKMSVFGLSYGTMVGAVYASVYPEYAGKLVLNGNVPPFPDKSTFATGAAGGLQQGVAKLLYNCQSHPDCRLENPERTFREILEDVRDGKMVARTRQAGYFRLPVGILIGTLADLLGDKFGKNWQVAMDLLKQLSRSKNGTEREKAVGFILNRTCHVKDTATWYEYGVCVGTMHVAEDDTSPGSDSFIEMNAVLSQDAVGRYTVDDVIRGWRTIRIEYGAVGSTAYLAQMAGMFDWPTIPTPVAPMGNPTTPALVIGNLYDPATRYTWSQQMHESFPAGSLMTWQGVGHCMTAYILSSKHTDLLRAKGMVGYDFDAMKDCHMRVLKFLETGELPRNGHVCRQSVKEVPAFAELNGKSM